MSYCMSLSVSKHPSSRLYILFPFQKKNGVRTAKQRNAAKRRYSSAFGCDKRNTQPTAAYVLQSHEILRHSAATNAMRGLQRRTHRSATKFLGIRMRRRQCVAHNGVRTAEQRNSWVCATKATRSPQRRTRRIATKFIDPCLPRDAILSLYWFYWLRTLYVIQ